MSGKIPRETINNILQAHTEGLNLFKQAKNISIEEKKNIQKQNNWKTKRLKTLNSHLEKGNPLGVIKRDMRFQGFNDLQKEWFEKTIENLTSNSPSNLENGPPTKPST